VFSENLITVFADQLAAIIEIVEVQMGKALGKSRSTIGRVHPTRSDMRVMKRLLGHSHDLQLIPDMLTIAM